MWFENNNISIVGASYRDILHIKEPHIVKDFQNGKQRLVQMTKNIRRNFESAKAGTRFVEAFHLWIY